MKMATARNASAGAVLPVPDGISSGTPQMAAPMATLTTSARWLGDAVTGVISGGWMVVREGAAIRKLASEVTAAPR